MTYNLIFQTLSEATVKRLAGFDIYETNVIPADHAEKLIGFAAHPSAVAIAMRYLQFARGRHRGQELQPEPGRPWRG